MKKMIIITQEDSINDFNDRIKKLYLIDPDEQFIYKGNLMISSYKENYNDKNYSNYKHIIISDNNFKKLLSLNFNKDVKNKRIIDFIRNNEIEECFV